MWSWDFISDRTDNGGKVRIVSVIDEYSRECLALQVARKLTANDFIGVMKKLVIRVIIGDYRWYYNEVWPHGGIGYRTLAQACREAQVLATDPPSDLRQKLDPTPETDTCPT